MAFLWLNPNRVFGASDNNIFVHANITAIYLIKIILNCYPELSIHDRGKSGCMLYQKKFLRLKIIMTSFGQNVANTLKQ